MKLFKNFQKLEYWHLRLEMLYHWYCLSHIYKSNIGNALEGPQKL